MKKWYHLMLDITDCNPSKIDEKNTQQLINCVIKSAKMKLLGAPYMACIDPTKQSIKQHTDGCSVVQFIETSSITVHTINSHRSVCFDIFSCKEFDIEKIVKIVTKHYKVARNNIQLHYIERLI